MMTVVLVLTRVVAVSVSELTLSEEEGDDPLVELFGSGRAFEAHLGEFDDLWIYQQTEAQWAEMPYEDTDCWVDPCVQQTEAKWISLDEELVLSTSLLQIATKVLLEVDYHQMKRRWEDCRIGFCISRGRRRRRKKSHASTWSCPVLYPSPLSAAS